MGTDGIVPDRGTAVAEDRRPDAAAADDDGVRHDDDAEGDDHRDDFLLLRLRRHHDPPVNDRPHHRCAVVAARQQHGPLNVPGDDALGLLPFPCQVKLTVNRVARLLLSCGSPSLSSLNKEYNYKNQSINQSMNELFNSAPSFLD